MLVFFCAWDFPSRALGIFPYIRKVRKMSKKHKVRSVATATPVEVTDVVENTQVAQVAEVTQMRVLPDLTQVAAVPEVAQLNEVVGTASPTQNAEVSEYGEFVEVAQVAPSKQKRYPREGGKCWLVWHQCDVLLANGTHPNVKHLRDWATLNGQNVSNASQEFYAWRKYWGRK
jgi:hypothetical protein